MPSSTTLGIQAPGIRSVSFARTALTFELEDGRSVTAPLDWYPRLKAGTAKERGHWELIGIGRGVHWPDLDEDISVENLLLGQRSRESQGAFQAWLASREGRRRSRGEVAARTAGVRALVSEALASLDEPYSEDVID